MWQIYVLRTRDGDLYTGIATDVDRRLAEHDAGLARGAKSLRGRGPLELAYRCPLGDRALALRVEYRVKRLSKEKKEQLVESGPDAETLMRLVGVESRELD